MPFLILSQSHNKPWSELHKFYHNHSFTSFQTNWISSDKIRFGKILTEHSRDVSIDLRLNLPFWAITCWQNECRLVPLPFRANPSPWPAPPPSPRPKVVRAPWRLTLHLHCRQGTGHAKLFFGHIFSIYVNIDPLLDEMIITTRLPGSKYTI